MRDDEVIVLGPGEGRTYEIAPMRIPVGVTHDFANRTDATAAAFNVFVPGGFEGPFASWAGAGY